MDYKLALQLKEAGFPQKAVNREKDEWLYYEPTLEELIEACGRSFETLSWYEYPTTWMAGAVDDELTGLGIECIGSTPTEAVARLWLAINKK